MINAGRKKKKRMRKKKRKERECDATYFTVVNSRRGGGRELERKKGKKKGENQGASLARSEARQRESAQSMARVRASGTEARQVASVSTSTLTSIALFREKEE